MVDLKKNFNSLSNGDYDMVHCLDPFCLGLIS